MDPEHPLNSKNNLASDAFDVQSVTMDSTSSPLSDYSANLSDFSDAAPGKPATLTIDVPVSHMPESPMQPKYHPTSNSNIHDPIKQETGQFISTPKTFMCAPMLSQVPTNQSSHPPSPIKAAKLPQDAAPVPSQIIRAKPFNSPTVPQPILRRSDRARRPPAMFNPPASVPRKTSKRLRKPQSLVVCLRINKYKHPQSIHKQTVSYPGFLSPTPTKRKHNEIATANHNEEPSRHRSRLELPPSYMQSMCKTLQILTQSIPEKLPQKSLEHSAPSGPTATRQENIPTCMLEDNTLRTIATNLLAGRSNVVSDVEPASRPEIWATTRTDLCETLPYYRAYNSACYATGGFASAFMFDASAHPRDYTDASVVISRAGGGLERDKKSGSMKMITDQKEDATVKSLQNSMNQFNPVVLLTGKKNSTMPSKPPHKFCVLDYFKPTHIWWEKTGNLKFIRFRFEKFKLEKPSWWQPKDTEEIAKPGSLTPPYNQICMFCHLRSEQVYLQGWMCLEPSCSAFWKLVSQSGMLEEPDENSLIYDPRFLKQKTPWPNDSQNYPLIPSEVELSGHDIAGEDCSRAQWFGIVCPRCGRCNSRLHSARWECATEGCDWKKEAPHTLIPAVSIRDPFFPVAAALPMSRDIYEADIVISVSFANNYRINKFIIPGIDGFVAHMIANKTVIEEPGGPDDMFEKLQAADIDFRRREMSEDHSTRHFSVNFGMPYKFLGEAVTSSFNDAPYLITGARSRLNWAAKWIHAQDQGKTIEEISAEWKIKEFNEVLALCYFEKQKIKYHDDGEAGLGPTIATLSLGATGTMCLRMKARYYNGVTKGANYDDSRPLPGCRKYEERLAYYNDLQTFKHDTKAFKARSTQIVKDLQLKAVGNARAAIEMTLGHGDIVIMHGVDIQKYFEHAVEHPGKLRYALTCRYIDLESLPENDRPGYAVEPDTGDYDGARLPMLG